MKHELPHLTLKSLLHRSVERFSDRPALSFVNGEPITYLEFGKQVEELSSLLHKHGIRAGDRVALLSESRPHWGIAFFAITTMGAVVVPILPDFHANEVHHILRHSEAKALFVSEQLHGKISEHQGDALETIIQINDFRVLTPATRQDRFKDAVKEGSKELTKLKDAAFRMTGRKPVDIEEFQEDDLPSIISTAGASGAAISQRARELTVLLQQQQITAGDRVAILSPQHLNWSVAFLAVQRIGGLAIPLLPDFEAEEIHHILRHAGCKAIILSPPLYEKIEEGTFETLTTVLSIENFRLLPPPRTKETIQGVLQQFTSELDHLRENFAKTSPESAREQLKDLLHRGNEELEKIQDAQELKEFVQYSHQELDKLQQDFTTISTETAKVKLREFLQYGSKELEKLKEAVSWMTGKETPLDVQEDDLASIIYTSGTTGKSKGVMLTNKNIVSNALSSAEIIVYCTPGQERFLSILPLSHTYECTIGFIVPLMYGACIYYLEKPPTPRVLLPAFQNVHPTMMLSVPLVIEKIYKLRIVPQLTKNVIMRKLYGFSTIRKRLHKIAGKKLYEMFGGKLHFFGIGGAPLSPDVEIFLRDAGFPYSVGYGLTETSPLIAGTNAKYRKFRSTGPIINGVEVTIENPNPETGEGEIVVRGPNVMKGYFKAPELTKDVLTEDGWFHTGDLGVFDEDRYLYIKGRLKNMILGPSGENIYPEEIEAVICEYEYVQEALMYKEQQHLVARVYLDYDKLDERFDTKKLSEGQIQQHVKDLLEELRKSVNSRVSSFSRLNRIIEQAEPFEKTPTKKIKRYLYVN